MKKLLSASIAALLLSVPSVAAKTYSNPVLAGDYSDPDVLRVGNDFYLVSSSFLNVPGLPILHSTDLVHWTIIAHALPKLEPVAHYAVPRHGTGVWAPAIRQHNGKFVIYYPDPDLGIFRVEASNPAGPWSAPVLVDDSKGAIDPCPFWDEDGTGWLVHAWARSRSGFGNIITLKRLNADGTKTLDKGTVVIDGAKLADVQTSNGLMPWTTTEGPKLYKRNGWYYIFVPSGSVKSGWQGVFRSRRIDGPYEGRNVLDQGTTDINGPHQGAWVTTASGEDWFLHFQDVDAYGRRVLLEPMKWVSDWPVIGRDPKNTGRGEPVLTWQKPKAPPSPEQAESDEFDAGLSPVWQWNANPADDWADTSKPGVLRLKSVSQPANLWEDGAVLSHKLPGEKFTATAKVTFSPAATGERTGLVMYGRDYGWIGLEKTATGLRLVAVERGGADKNNPEKLRVLVSSAPSTVYFRLEGSPVTVAEPPPSFSPYWPSWLKSKRISVHLSYSLDGVTFASAGTPFEATQGAWVGAQVGIFAQAPSGTPSYVSPRVGAAEYDWVRFSY